MGMASLNGNGEVKQANTDIGLTGGGLSTIQEEFDDDQEMVGPVVPTARKRRVMTDMALTTGDGVARYIRRKKMHVSLKIFVPHAEAGQRARISACTALSRDV